MVYLKSVIIYCGGFLMVVCIFIEMINYVEFLMFNFKF